MKQNQQQKTDPAFTPMSKATEVPKMESNFFLPPGYRLNDIYMDTSDISQELKICKRKVTNMRKAGKLSHTFLEENGKIYYFRKEFATTLEGNTVIGKNSPMSKLRISSWIAATASTLISLLGDFSFESCLV